MVGIKPRQKGPNPDSEKIRENIYDVVHSEWPTYATEIVEKLGMDTTTKKDLLLIKYHLDQLAKEGRVRVKKIDRAQVAWPADMEKLRVVHEIMKMS